MSDKLTEEQKEALERFRSQKDDPNSISSFIYGILKGADPRFVDMIEHQAAVALHAGYTAGRELAKADMDPKRSGEIRRRLRETATRINATINKQAEEQEE